MKLFTIENFTAPNVPENITIGDMPGDQVHIEDSHIQKAAKIFPQLLQCINNHIEKTNCSKLVVSVCGGSGVGKSETASLFSFFFETMGVKSYILSGDNYPHRIPLYNDAERLRMFRTYGIENLVTNNTMNDENFTILQKLQQDNEDADRKYETEYAFIKDYIDGGMVGLSQYLGTKNEIDFDKISNIIAQFKSGKESIWLKRMGRTETELWYDYIDMKEKEILFVEWTHGNNDNLEGVDIVVFLNSTPAETLAHRQARNRDKGADSAFIDKVLEVEQGLLARQAKKASLIVTKDGNVIDYDAYVSLMGE